MKKSCRLTLGILSIFWVISTASAQIVLSGTSYSQDFDGIGSGLPTGWTVTTDASTSTLGNSAIFTTTAVRWGAANSSGLFRNSSSSNIASSSSSASQSSNINRALGWRPSTAAQRDGSILLTIQDTEGFENFTLNLSVFTFNDVTATATYALEYRVGDSGNFKQIGDTYDTGTEFSQTNYTISSVTLSAIEDQSETVYIRLRGTTPSGTGSLDGIAIDDFSLSFSAVPEPSSFAAFLGLGALGLAATRRRGRKASPLLAA